MSEITDEHVAEVWGRLTREAAEAGYSVNPDDVFAKDLVRGLLENEARYGYRACPCRLASGAPDQDRDLVCPCDYRDADLDEYGACYCALYVSPEIARGGKKAASIPDRRLPGGPPAVRGEEQMERVAVRGLPFPVWRCRVCPVCKAGKERFERFM
jgi:ferredoxin-thioredoxin reductase catalytic chain